MHIYKRTHPQNIHTHTHTHTHTHVSHTHTYKFHKSHKSQAYLAAKEGAFAGEFDAHCVRSAKGTLCAGVLIPSLVGDVDSANLKELFPPGVSGGVKVSPPLPGVPCGGCAQPWFSYLLYYICIYTYIDCKF